MPKSQAEVCRCAFVDIAATGWRGLGGTDWAEGGAVYSAFTFVGIEGRLSGKIAGGRTMSERQGGCSCKATRYTLTEEPMFTHVCHCSICKRHTGTAFVTHIFIESAHLEVTEGPVELVVGILTDAAGVEDDHVGIGDVVDAVHPVGLEQAGDPLRVVLVHLTAVRLDDVGLALTAHSGVVHLIGHASEVTDSSPQAVVRPGTDSSATG